MLSVRALLAVLALAACAPSAAQPAQPAPIIGVASVIDGDTLQIHGENIRLDGFDAPERGRVCAGGVNAKQITSNALDRYIAGRTVNCAIVGHDDRWDRPVGRCSVGDQELGAWMVEQGWGRDWPRYSGGAYQAQEQAARAARRGVWGMDCPGLWGNRDYSLQQD